MMNLLISLLVFALVFSGALAGMAVRPLLSEHHLHSDSKDVVKLTVGLIGTLTALVLGLLIASAKTTFDQKANQVRQLSATIILLDDLVTQYGPEAISLRKLLRQSIPPMADRIWHEQAKKRHSSLSGKRSCHFRVELPHSRRRRPHVSQTRVLTGKRG